MEGEAPEAEPEFGEEAPAPRRSWLKHLLIGAALLLAFSAVLLVWWARARAAPTLSMHRSRWGNMNRIVGAAARFNTQRGRLPRGLSELVAAGLLPREGEMYFCPMKHDTIKPRSLPYTECEFELSFSPEEFVIAIPEDVFKRPRYRFLNPGTRVLRLQATAKVLLP